MNGRLGIRSFMLQDQRSGVESAILNQSCSARTSAPSSTFVSTTSFLDLILVQLFSGQAASFGERTCELWAYSLDARCVGEMRGGILLTILNGGICRRDSTVLIAHILTLQIRR